MASIVFPKKIVVDNASVMALPLVEQFINSQQRIHSRFLKAETSSEESIYSHVQKVSSKYRSCISHFIHDLDKCIEFALELNIDVSSIEKIYDLISDSLILWHFSEIFVLNKLKTTLIETVHWLQVYSPLHQVHSLVNVALHRAASRTWSRCLSMRWNRDSLL